MIIGAGFGRTGTTSLRFALEQLTNERCYCMTELWANPSGVHDWALADAGRYDSLLDALEGYGATVDWPGAAYVPELLHVYPEAKVILTVRQPEVWVGSFAETILPLLWTKRTTPLDWVRRRVIIQRALRGAYTPEALLESYNLHNMMVRALVPKSRLLEFQPGDGWDPLCEFLGYAVPSVPFPRLNDRGTFDSLFKEPVSERYARQVLRFLVHSSEELETLVQSLQDIGWLRFT